MDQNIENIKKEIVEPLLDNSFTLKEINEKVEQIIKDYEFKGDDNEPFDLGCYSLAKVIKRITHK